MHKRLLLILLLSFVFCTASAYAGIAVTPARQEITLAPGGTYQGSYTVRNEYESPAQVHVESRDWFVLPENKGTKIADWLNIEPSEIPLLQPGESKEVHFTVHLPETAQGVSVAMLSFVPQVENDQGITLVVSVSLFVTAAGTEKRDWDIGKVSFSTFSNFSVSASILNKGNVHVRPQGNVEIFSRRLFGRKSILRMDFNGERPVYPGIPRAMVASNDGFHLAKGKYLAVVQVNAGEEMKTKKVKFSVNKAGEIKNK